VLDPAAAVVRRAQAIVAAGAVQVAALAAVTQGARQGAKPALQMLAALWAAMALRAQQITARLVSAQITARPVSAALERTTASKVMARLAALVALDKPLSKVRPSKVRLTSRLTRRRPLASAISEPLDHRRLSDPLRQISKQVPQLKHHLLRDQRLALTSE